VTSPLDLRGPEFLVFYAIVSLCVLLLLWIVRAAFEGGRAPRLETTDPYQIAYLRGGANETLRVATVMLLDRHLLAAETLDGVIVARAKPDDVRRPIEKALLRHFAQSHAPQSIFGDPALAEVCEPYRRRLTELGLLPTGADTFRRCLLLLGVVVLLGGLSLAKIDVALSRGRTNIVFLIVLTTVALVVGFKIALPRATARGRAVLADLRRLFQRLRDRVSTVRPGGASADAALLAAVFGLGVLPAEHFAYATALFPKAKSSSGSCGSSCGSSCGGGGSGCGGGCGGCGGGGD